eukprot:SAG31_NODE_846_length_11539_cov_70.858392_8_plen_99_part_00
MGKCLCGVMGRSLLNVLRPEVPSGAAAPRKRRGRASRLAVGWSGLRLWGGGGNAVLRAESCTATKVCMVQHRVDQNATHHCLLNLGTVLSSIGIGNSA